MMKKMLVGIMIVLSSMMFTACGGSDDATIRTVQNIKIGRDSSINVNDLADGLVRGLQVIQNSSDSRVSTLSRYSNRMIDPDIETYDFAHREWSSPITDHFYNTEVCPDLAENTTWFMVSMEDVRKQEEVKWTVTKDKNLGNVIKMNSKNIRWIIPYETYKDGKDEMIQIFVENSFVEIGRDGSKHNTQVIFSDADLQELVTLGIGVNVMHYEYVKYLESTDNE